MLASDTEILEKFPSSQVHTQRESGVILGITTEANPEVFHTDFSRYRWGLR